MRGREGGDGDVFGVEREREERKKVNGRKKEGGGSEIEERGKEVERGRRNWREK